MLRSVYVVFYGILKFPFLEQLELWIICHVSDAELFKGLFTVHFLWWQDLYSKIIELDSRSCSFSAFSSLGSLGRLV